MIVLSLEGIGTYRITIRLAGSSETNLVKSETTEIDVVGGK